MASGGKGIASFVGDTGETQFHGGSPPAQPYLSGHYHQHRHSPQR